MSYALTVPCNEWNPLFGIAGALAGIYCKLDEGHEGDHLIKITLGRNPTTEHTVTWKEVVNGL